VRDKALSVTLNNWGLFSLTLSYFCGKIETVKRATTGATQMTYLRLDLYINGKEILINESDEATAQEYENLVQCASIVSEGANASLMSNGFVTLSADEIADEDMQNVLWDFVGREVKATDEVMYVMCLWQHDEWGDPEHVREQVRLVEFE
jgi:hypothetical protein